MLATAEEVSALAALGRWDEALEVGARVGDLTEEMLSTIQDIGIAYARIYGARGETEMLERVRVASMPQLDSLDGQIRSAARATVAIAAQEQGRVDEAIDLLRDVVTAQDAYAQRFAFFEAGRAALTSGDEHELERLLGWVRAAPPNGASPLTRAVTEVLAGALASRRGDHAAAGELLDQGVKQLRALGHPFELGWALLERGGAMTRAGNLVEAAESLGDARQIFTRLRAELWIQRVDDVTESSAMRV
jgi:tetratricopeptide (TPR) repeat protein